MNIFQRLAKENDFENFSNVVPEKDAAPSNSMQPQAKPVNESNISAAVPQGNIFQQMATKEKEKKSNEFGFIDTARDIGEQAVSKGISGFLGAYGNILDAFGLQAKEGEMLPGQQARNSSDFSTLDKLNRGEQPSWAELMLLTDSDTNPEFTRFPNSQQIQQGIQQFTGIGEGQTPQGRIAGNAAGFLGEGVSISGGAKALAGLSASGAAGQGIREAGGPEWAATGTEILGSILPTAISKNLAPLSKSGKDIVKAGRKIGLTESNIAPLLQSEGKTAVIAPISRKGSRVKNVFGDLREKLGESYGNIKDKVSNMGNVNNANRQILETKFTNIRNDMSKTLKASPDKEAAIKFIDDAISEISKNGASPEKLINFWQDINKSVKWNSIQGGKKSLTKLKEPILEVLNNVAPGAAKDFEMTNQLYTKYAQIAKKLKPDLVDSFVNKGELLAAVPSAYAIVQGNPWPLVSLGTEASIRLLGREMLINPYFQTIAGKLVNNFNSGSVKAIQGTVKQVQEYMQRKHPNEDWEFLTRDLKEDN